MAKKKKGVIGEAIDHLLHPGERHEDVENGDELSEEKGPEVSSDADARLETTKAEKNESAEQAYADHPKFHKFKK